MLSLPPSIIARVARRACTVLRHGDHALGISESLLAMLDDAREAFDRFGEAPVTSAEAERIAREERALCAALCERMADTREREAMRSLRLARGAMRARRLRIEAGALREAAVALRRALDAG